MVPRFEKRVKAYAADLSGLALAFLVASFGISNMVAKISVVVLAYVLISILPQFFSRGQTFGKRIQKIKVVKNDGSDASLILLIVREIFKTGVSILTFGLYSIIAFFFISEKHVSKTIHDYIFGTKVIDLAPQYRKNEGGFLDKGESMKKRGL